MNCGIKHCVKNVRIRSYSCPYFPAFRLIFSPNAGKYGPEKLRHCIWRSEDHCRSIFWKALYKAKKIHLLPYTQLTLKMLFKFVDSKIFISIIIVSKTILQKKRPSSQYAAFPGKWEKSHTPNGHMANRTKWTEFYHLDTFGQFCL